MHLVYAENEEPFTGRPVPYDQQNACRTWLRLYANHKYLRFVLDAPGSTFVERRQADRELAICQSKMDRAQRHPNWYLAGVAEGRAAEDRRWASRPASWLDPR